MSCHLSWICHCVLQNQSILLQAHGSSAMKLQKVTITTTFSLIQTIKKTSADNLDYASVPGLLQFSNFHTIQHPRKELRFQKDLQFSKSAKWHLFNPTLILLFSIWKQYTWPRHLSQVFSTEIQLRFLSLSHHSWSLYTKYFWTPYFFLPYPIRDHERSKWRGKNSSPWRNSWLHYKDLCHNPPSTMS